ncbi:hypothetical protein [Massilia soli]|uniref:Uncharacterized protein n=1 Tax=Massilia soli TaxID=2792854 RepID=A0ABS7SRL1_9BURK|nr:hypothetical protein [Massilia soli]MBZ2208582.1 hypothetical protein [Massilia soli]
MTARTLMQQCTDELLDLMRLLGKMHDAVQRGEPVPLLTAEQTQTLILTVGDAMMTNHRALRSKQNAGHVAA